VQREFLLSLNRTQQLCVLQINVAVIILRTAQCDTQDSDRDNKLIQNHGRKISNERLLLTDISVVTILLAGFLSLYTATVGTAWSLLGSHRNGHAVLYLFQKHVYYTVHVHPDVWNTHPPIQWGTGALRG
jgi:hypothetical protein